MLAARFQALLALWLLYWQDGAAYPRGDDECPRWYELPHWC